MDETFLLEYKGFSCIARKYQDGRWGFGNTSHQHSGFDTPDKTDSPFDFLWLANNIEEAKTMFPRAIEAMLERQAYNNKTIDWKSKTDYKSVAAIVNILPDVFEKRIQEGNFDTKLLQAVEGGDYVVPLYYVTKAWDNMLKGSLASFAYMIGPEESEEFSEEELEVFLKEEHAKRSRGEAVIQNDKMKALWKKYFNIDIDSLEVDFLQYDMHIPPHWSEDEYLWYFYDPLYGLKDWILSPVNNPSEEWIFHDSVSAMMEFTANIIIVERNKDPEDYIS